MVNQRMLEKKQGGLHMGRRENKPVASSQTMAERKREIWIQHAQRVVY